MATTEKLSATDFRYVGGIQPGKDFKVSFNIQNLTGGSLNVCAQIPRQNDILSSVHVVGTIAARATVSTTITIKVNPADDFRGYPLRLRINLQDTNTSTLYHAVLLTIPASSLLAAISTYRENINILIFGEYGSGKTSYMLTSKTAFAGRMVFQDPELGRIGGGNTHASTTFRQVRLTDKVSFWDPWGSSPTNYKDGEFKYMITGRVPKGWEMDRPLTLDNIIKDNAAANRNKPHAVFFIISQGQVEDNEYMGRLRGWVDTLSKERPELTPLILLSKIDEIDVDLRKNADAHEDNQLLSDKMAKLSASTGVPRMMIFPILSYIEERRPSDLIDRLALNVVMEAAYQASRIATQK